MADPRVHAPRRVEDVDDATVEHLQMVLGGLAVTTSASTDEFTQVLEACGLIVATDAWMMRPTWQARHELPARLLPPEPEPEPEEPAEPLERLSRSRGLVRNSLGKQCYHRFCEDCGRCQCTPEVFPWRQFRHEALLCYECRDKRGLTRGPRKPKYAIRSRKLPCRHKPCDDCKRCMCTPGILVYRNTKAEKRLCIECKLSIAESTGNKRAIRRLKKAQQALQERLAQEA